MSFDQIKDLGEQCEYKIDYSKIPGEKVLPFKIELNLNKSRLNPPKGQNQKFCYDIIGVGSDGPNLADLKHIVFGICQDIDESEIKNVTVTVNGVIRKVNFGEGGNLELKTPKKPDFQTKCPGLKFDFEVDKKGIMNICFELTSRYSIGPISVCLYGGNHTSKGLYICGPSCSVTPSVICPAVGYQSATVCVPVTVTPFANIGKTETFCCGDPIIKPVCDCEDDVDGQCKFTITQNICVKVPVGFGAITCVGDTSIDCGKPTSHDICDECDSDLDPCKPCDDTPYEEDHWNNY